MEEKIIIENQESFNLKHIFECGQCFRWNEEEDGSWIGVIKDAVIKVRIEDNYENFTTKEWKLTVCIPDFQLSTEIARSILPKEVPMQDAIFNAKHLAMLIHAVNTSDPKLMKVALKDKLHQPYREEPHMERQDRTDLHR